MTAFGLPPLQITDFRSAMVRIGTKEYGRCRVLWADGEFRLFNRTGCILSIAGGKPERKRFLSRTWVADTSKGQIEIKETCQTCDKWWQIAFMDKSALWETGNDGG